MQCFLLLCFVLSIIMSNSWHGTQALFFCVAKSCLPQKINHITLEYGTCSRYMRLYTANDIQSVQTK